jgi:uncharacterized RDD family membrane protein YckC
VLRGGQSRSRGEDRDMPAVHFTNLLSVAAVGLLAPLVLGFFPPLRLPAIVLGIVIGPSGLGWVTPDLPVSILALASCSSRPHWECSSRC